MALVKGGYTRINHIEDATKDTLEYQRGFIVEVGGLLHIGTEHFVTESFEIIDINMVLIDFEFIIAHVAQIFPQEHRPQWIWISLGPPVASGLRAGLHRPIDEF